MEVYQATGGLVEETQLPLGEPGLDDDKFTVFDRKLDTLRKRSKESDDFKIEERVFDESTLIVAVIRPLDFSLILTSFTYFESNAFIINCLGSSEYSTNRPGLV